MCQLSLIFIKNKEIIRKASINAAVINPLKAEMKEVLGHVDGFGFFINRNRLRKTRESGHVINFSKVNYTVNPIIQHVRKVSHGKITDENAHPFEFDYFVAAHNGTLKGGFIKENKEEQRTDSEQFFDYANNLIKNNPGLSVLEAFKLTYNKIEGGKFAFLVYDKRLDKYFVIRGKAPLHYSLIYKEKDIIGVIVNTEKNSLLMNLYLLRAEFGISFTEPKLLEENTIYSLDEENINLVEEKEIKIVQKDVVKRAVVVSSYTDYWSNNRGHYGVQEKNNNTNYLEMARLLFKKKRYSTELLAREIYSIMVYAIISGVEDKNGINKIIKNIEEHEIKDPVQGYGRIISESDGETIKVMMEVAEGFISKLKDK